MAIILVSLGLELLSVRLTLSPPLSLTSLLGLCLLGWTITIIICGGTGYLAARHSRGLIRNGNDAGSVAFLSGGVVALVMGTDRFVIPPILLAIADHLCGLSILNLITSLISGVIMTAMVVFFYGAIAYFGGRLYFYRSVRGNQG